MSLHGCSCVCQVLFGPRILKSASVPPILPLRRISLSLSVKRPKPDQTCYLSFYVMLGPCILFGLLTFISHGKKFELGLSLRVPQVSAKRVQPLRPFKTRASQFKTVATPLQTNLAQPSAPKGLKSRRWNGHQRACE